jgi:hypothetical protein
MNISLEISLFKRKPLEKFPSGVLNLMRTV